MNNQLQQKMLHSPGRSFQLFVTALEENGKQRVLKLYKLTQETVVAYLLFSLLLMGSQDSKATTAMAKDLCGLTESREQGPCVLPALEAYVAGKVSRTCSRPKLDIAPAPKWLQRKEKEEAFSRWQIIL